MNLWMVAAQAAQNLDGGTIIAGILIIGCIGAALSGKKSGGSSSSSSHSSWQQRQDDAREHLARREIEQRDARNNGGW